MLKSEMPKFVKDIARLGAACAAVRHSPAAGGLSQEAVPGAILVMSAAVIWFALRKGEAVDSLAASANISTLRVVKIIS